MKGPAAKRRNLPVRLPSQGPPHSFGVPKRRPPQPAPGPLSGLPRNAGACSPFPPHLRSGDPRHPRHQAITVPAGGFRLALGQRRPWGPIPWLLVHRAQLQTHCQLIRHKSSLSTFSPWRPGQAAAKPGRRAHLRPYLPRRCHHLGEDLERPS